MDVDHSLYFMQCVSYHCDVQKFASSTLEVERVLHLPDKLFLSPIKSTSHGGIIHPCFITRPTDLLTVKLLSILGVREASVT